MQFLFLVQASGNKAARAAVVPRGGAQPHLPHCLGAPHTPQAPTDSRLWGQDLLELFGVSVTDPLTAECSPQDVSEEEGNDNVEVLIF